MQANALSKSQVLIMAIAAGASAANIYYNQPILKEIASSLHVNETQAGSISMLSQIGYGLGLFFLIPLGDKINKKKLILVLLLMLTALLVLMTLSNTIQQIWILSVAIGVLSVSAQVILPMAASIDRVTTGKTVGNIFTGLLIGILAARVCSGLIASWLGWRAVYGFSAVLILIVTVLLKISLPDVKNDFSGHYFELLKSTLYQVKRFAILREAALTGSLIFGVFCSFWTTVTFHLSGAPFFYHTDKIGLFGLVAIAGALLAPVFGKLADKGKVRYSLIIAISLVVISLVFIKLFPLNIPVLIAAVLLLDMGVQAMQVTNIAIIYTLDKSSNSRINTVYMTSYFIGGALGSFAGLTCWRAGGWNFVVWQMLSWALIALAIILFGKYSRINIKKQN
jgi:predicted MFS family arabinose efflux permease